MNQYTNKQPSASALGVSEAEAARAELYGTLGQLRDRLNYAQRIDDAVDDAKMRIMQTKQNRPLAFIGGCVGVAAVAGLVVWGVARAIAGNRR